jgi:hypothetical protein
VRIPLVLALLFAACESTSAPTLTPSVPATLAAPSGAPRIARIWLGDPSVAVINAEETVDGDRESLVGVDFTGPPAREPVERALVAGLPPASGLEWRSERELVAHVPPGGAFSVDLSGIPATPTSGGGPPLLRFVVDRPTYEVALYRPADLLAGSRLPVRTWTNHLALEFVAAVAPDGRRILAYHRYRARGSTFSLIDLDSGIAAALPEPFENIAGSGLVLMDWLPDGRLLGVGTSTSYLARGDGSDPQQLPGLVGQSAVLSPARSRLLLWSYADGSAAILDLTTRQLHALVGTFPRCTVGGDVGLTWFDEQQVIVSDCSADLGGENRTHLIDARSGQSVALYYGHQVRAVLANGAQLRATVQPAAAMRSPDREVWLADITGKRVAGLDAGARLLAAPDGSSVAYVEEDPLRSIVLDAFTGRSATIDGVRAMAWTKQGELLAIRRLLQRPA